MSKHPASYLTVRKCSFFPFTVLKVLALSIWRCSLGPKWPMTRYCVHCTLCGERGSDGEPKNRTWDEVGGPNYVPGRVIDISHRNLSSAHPLKAPPPPKQPHLITGIVHDNMCVWFYQKTTPLFRKCLPFFLARAQLFNRNCLSAAFYVLRHKNAFVLCVRLQHSEHRASTDSFSQSPLRSIYRRSNVQGFNISHTQGCSQTCTVWLFLQEG